MKLRQRQCFATERHLNIYANKAETPRGGGGAAEGRGGGMAAGHENPVISWPEGCFQLVRP